MKADAVPVLDLFEKKMQIDVPLFQRQYVWGQEQQWEPLWEDISRKFSEVLEGRKDAPVHFLGAMVLDQKLTPATHVEKRLVIDGQQRLTTLQIFLAAMRDFCREQGCHEIADEFDKHTLNTGKMAEPETERFKVWPTHADREQFSHVMTLGSRAAIERQYPLVWRRYARRPDPRPRMVDAYLFFSDQLQEFFLGAGDVVAPAAAVPLEDRLDEAFKALKHSLHVVEIDLDKDDDAQVIFETLNARGEPLLPADLLRNYVFLRAARAGESPEDLYRKYWAPFDEDFWREVVTQGRLKRPRSDLFLQHFLASRQGADIPIKNLYVEYRHWIERVRPFDSVEGELRMLSQQGRNFRRIVQPSRDDVVYELATFMENFDIRTAYPLLLRLLDSDLDGGEWRRVSTTIESYLLRRAVVGMPTKAYNRVFLSLVRSLRKSETGPTSAAVASSLSDLAGESSAWPTDSQFAEAWLTGSAYADLNSAKLCHILKRVSDTYLTDKSEHITTTSPLTVEHILPQAWIENWPLPSGEPGYTWEQLSDAQSDDPRAVATRKRHAAVHNIGNLTIITQPLNSSVSNSGWSQKKVELLKASLLPINQQLHDYATWDEESISRRGADMLRRAMQIWPPAGNP